MIPCLLLGVLLADPAAGPTPPVSAPAKRGDTGVNPLFHELVSQGISVPDGPTVKFPAPLTESADKDQLIEKAAGRVPVELFLRRSVTAPFSLTIDSVDKSDGSRCGQMIRLYFVVYGKLDAVGETDFVKQLVTGKGRAGEDGPLRADALKKRGIRPLDQAGLKESYDKVLATILDKVQVEGVNRTLHARTPHQVVYATKLDDRFQNDPQNPNRWRTLLAGAETDRPGPPHPYAGMGGYVVVTELPQPKDALLVEMHFFLHEPPNWFGGRNLLRSKLPTAIQENVRSFRRKVSRD